jgi:CHAT domain-containing protein
LEGERLKLQAEIKTKFPDYEKLVHPAPPSVSEVAQQLEVHQALLMLLPTSDAVYVWAVTADRPAAFARVELKEEQVKALVARLRHQFDFAAGAGKQYDSAAAYELYDKLLAPLASAWQGKTQLIIAAGGALSQLPFAVLQTRPNGGFGANAPWLIRQAAIAQVPSLSGDPTFALNSTAATPGAPNNARSITLTRTAWLADLSNPNPGTNSSSALLYSDIPALPDTRVELLEIAQALKADADRDVVLGQSATRNSVLEASRSGLLATKRVIAFATHGLMAGDLPNLTQPALAMAATGAESTQPLAPLLTLEDVLTLKLNADWVVLSACNTAAADGKGEESLSGLARGFFYAGSRSLLVTHWAVESESARLLTTATFAHYVANPQAPKAESLRQAMLSVMAMPQYQHPAYWAPYALVGDGGR